MIPASVTQVLREELEVIEREIVSLEGEIDSRAKVLAADQARLLTKQLARAEIAAFLGPDEAE